MAEIKRFVDDQAYRFAHWTARRHKNLVKQVFDFAVANGWLRVSPLTNKPVMVPGTDPKRDDIPEVEDVAKLLDVLLTRLRPRNFASKQLVERAGADCAGALMGLRPGEIAGLQWENVDLTKWTISVEHTLSHFDGLKGPKTKSSYRILDLEPLSHRVLKEHAERTINGGLGRTTERRQLTGYVFDDCSGTAGRHAGRL